MRYLATMLVAVCFFLNSLVGIVGTVVVCIHKDIVHISAAPNHCCSFYGNIHSGNSIGKMPAALRRRIALIYSLATAIL